MTAYPTKVAKVSHIVSGLTQRYSTNIPIPPRAPEKSITCADEIVPVAVARRAVRNIRASTRCSIKQLTAKAAAANNQIPIVPAITFCISGKVGVARNMPITAQKTASCVTRGFVSTRYCLKRLGEVAVKLDMVTI
jgi:hypothetical protein